ncbi:MAG: rod shape-determining protein MreC [Actinobacteria bacterium]|jgi:rod shape-determining protein MreC|uniref:Cell shape-determining protein MreC n=2 Tax=freshwater metagenome TaxID=449393 RepID=A0A6J5YWM0_9ZZZZ|nr:rod shape-determining protein MreC [Actinomycetota bacterium]MSV65144.1 rod shape-determining protein MreC [Actinomycetota bacterium]MSX69103.1 rod shape-determining protein MreC [Actinomycetota bacterium]MSY15703.1 rod shape-determining protein MreC [Actinomycetota bacterium]MSY64637.1 rod shape-determining protein MreC [Actinomycetota bacterium]
MARGGSDRSRLLLVLLLVSSLFLITLDLRGVNLAGGLRSATQTVLSPVENLFAKVFSPVGNFFGDAKNLGKSRKKIEELTTEVDKLTAQAAINEDIAGQLNQLKGVLDLAGRGGYKVVAAKVINRGSNSTFKQTITIDAGSSSGIEKNMTVISEAGLVGVVKSVTSNTAIVLLMSDPTFKIGVRIAGTQSVGVVSGQGGDSYLLQLLDTTGEIKKGDVLIARGSDNNRPFVPGVPVGVVNTVQSNASSITQNADVDGITNLDKIGVVAVVITAPAEAARESLYPKPAPVVTVFVTPTPTPSPTTKK